VTIQFKDVMVTEMPYVWDELDISRCLDRRMCSLLMLLIKHAVVSFLTNQNPGV